MPSIVGGLDIHRKQLTFDYLNTATGEVACGQVAPADREHLRRWLTRLEGAGDVPFAAEAANTAAAPGRKKRAKINRAGARLLRDLLAQQRVPEYWIPPSHILECRALLETYHDLRREHTANGCNGSAPSCFTRARRTWARAGYPPRRAVSG